MIGKAKPAQRATRPRPAIDPEILEEFSEDVEMLQHVVGELRGLVEDLRTTLAALAKVRQPSGRDGAPPATGEAPGA